MIVNDSVKVLGIVRILDQAKAQMVELSTECAQADGDWDAAELFLRWARP